MTSLERAVMAAWDSLPGEYQVDAVMDTIWAAVRAAIAHEREAIACMVESGDYPQGFQECHRDYEDDLVSAIRARR